ncbi:MAG: plasmid pRiA4b ORF-3 family protein [Ginsengibacter sp.]
MAFEFRIQMKGISRPPVWRQLKIPDNCTFHQFHLAIQISFGWYNSHLYLFSKRGFGSDFSIQIPYGESEFNEVDSRKTKLKSIFKKVGDQFLYIYDFGDSWTHHIILDKITTEKILKPICINGKGKCPPEDCGGVDGYQDFLEAVQNPDNPEYEETRVWIGLENDEEWNPAEFDLEEVNKMLD